MAQTLVVAAVVPNCLNQAGELQIRSLPRPLLSLPNLPRFYRWESPVRPLL
jgi:hypothetical protein